MSMTEERIDHEEARRIAKRAIAEPRLGQLRFTELARAYLALLTESTEQRKREQREFERIAEDILPSGKTLLSEMREYAAELDPDMGPLFGRDVVRVIDAFFALVIKSARQRKALEHYAEPGHWSEETGDVYTTWGWDGGKNPPWAVAAEALASPTKGEGAKCSRCGGQYGRAFAHGPGFCQEEHGHERTWGDIGAP
jgi:hypothetical protein